MNALIWIILSLVIFALLIWGVTVTCPTRNVTEGWVDYEELPYGNVRSGAGNAGALSASGLASASGVRPMVFYEYKTYRRPLNWPICHLVDYPVPHCRSDSL
jgi:hypothetical protein